ncbi:DUF669 domain-containing protein [Lactobacillus delbrueckii subsp. lactis]|uniref:DUF669 domain-containing protein n=1 Tax=Lactobacillus delbrueckii TaxID=1584 RepID=UPI001E5C9401|nr:DUF669 domain-containing protein [Lactobacillus delbrueckii]MCD5606241.1 DUF669 domain-containing protein [Lactobacillus delbrueckii subsp. lactis]
MAFFTVGKVEKKSNYEPIPAGYYEMNIKSVSQDATKSGTEYLSIVLRIRDDLDQALPETNGKYHNRLVFANVWKDKAQDYKVYKNSDLNFITVAAGYEEGTVFSSFEQWCDSLTGKNVRVKVSVSEDTYQGKTTKRNQVWPSDFEPTQFPTQAQMQSQPQPFAQSQPQAQAQVNDNDLPF